MENYRTFQILAQLINHPKQIELIIQKIQSKTMFWCHNCQLIIQSIQELRCEICSYEAIEQIQSENHPENFQPYVSQQNTQTNNNNHSHNHQNVNQVSGQRQSFFSNLMRNPFGIEMMETMSHFGGMGSIPTIFASLGNAETPLLVRYTVRQPVFGILLINNEDEEKVSVPEQKIDSLQKVQIKEQCTICQEKEGSGLKLPCNHEFHEKCIKPWFEQANTCPCCRQAV